MPWNPYRRMPCRSESSKGIAYREARSGSVTWKEVSNTATIGTGRPTAARAARIPAMLGGLWSGAISSRESIAFVTVSSIRVVPGKYLPPWTTRCPIASMWFLPPGNRVEEIESTHARTRWIASEWVATRSRSRAKGLPSGRKERSESPPIRSTTPRARRCSRHPPVGSTSTSATRNLTEELPQLNTRMFTLPPLERRTSRRLSTGFIAGRSEAFGNARKRKKTGLLPFPFSIGEPEGDFQRGAFRKGCSPFPSRRESGTAKYFAGMVFPVRRGCYPKLIRGRNAGPEGERGESDGAGIEKVRTVQGGRFPHVPGGGGGVAPGNPRVGPYGGRDEDPENVPVPGLRPGDGVREEGGRSCGGGGASSRPHRGMGVLHRRVPDPQDPWSSRKRLHHGRENKHLAPVRPPASCAGRGEKAAPAGGVSASTQGSCV